MLTGAHPILSCDDARRFEAALFGGDEAKEWTAMQAAGNAIGEAVLRDFQEIGGFPAAGRVLVLAGKGHNGGDALLAARRITEAFPAARVDVVLVAGERALRPLALRAYQALVHAAPAGVALVRLGALSASYDLVLDGVFGFQFRPPLPAGVVSLLGEVNACAVRLRAAVDLPSGLGEPGSFQADFTYATGIVKTPLLTLPNAGRLRYLDLGFHVQRVLPEASQAVLTAAVLAPLRALRPPQSDKRSYGHLAVLGGSRRYPGAVLMSVRAAVRSGAGLVTAFVPESLAPAFAAQLPEAMWVGWPETPEGGLALEGSHLMRELAGRFTALLAGPGLAREPETLALVHDIVKNASVPVVLDADALQPDIVRAGGAPRVLTPHAGEFARFGGGQALSEFVAATGSVVVLKGPVTRIGSAGRTDCSLFGGPVLARGGSGDVLAGLIGGQLAQAPADPLAAAARGVVWHGLAADLLARAHGAVAVQTTQLLDFLPAALRETPAAHAPGEVSCSPVRERRDD